jgi:hypothetical protein
MFQSVHAHWQLHVNSCLLAAVRCTNLLSCVIGCVYRRRRREVNMGKGREDHLCIKKLKEYSNRNLKDKLWYQVYESVVTNWSERPAE